jgi:IS30 family transposase
VLKEFIQQRLDQRWSPEQICQALRTAFPDEPERHLAHETVYLPHRGGRQPTQRLSASPLGPPTPGALQRLGLRADRRGRREIPRLDLRPF